MSEREHSMKLSGEMYKKIFNVLPHPSYIWQRIENNLILISYNEAAKDITEGKVEDLIGIKASDQYKERPTILEDLNQCLNNKKKISREVVYKMVTTGKEKNLIRFYDFIEPDLVLVHTEDISKQKQAEESLKREEREKSMILDAVSDLILYYDTTQNIIWANNASNESLNLPNEALIGRKCYELWHDRNEPCEKCPVLRAKFSGTTQSGEIKSPDGRIWQVLGFPVRNDEGTTIGMVEICRDITESKVMEKELKDREQFLQNVFDAIQDGISILDGDLNIVKVNPWMEKMYASNLPLVGKKCYEVYQSRTSICPWCPSIKTIESGEMHREIVPYPSAENPSGWIDLSAFPIKDEKGNVVNIIEYVKDITKQKKAENKLKESEESFRTITEQSLMGICIIQDFEIKYINQQMADIYGYSLEEVYNWQAKDFFKVLQNESKDFIIDQIKKKQEGSNDVKKHYISKAFRKDGSTIWVENYSKSIIYQGRPADLLTQINITDKKEAEEKLKDSEEKYRDMAELLPDTIFETGLDLNLKYVNPAGYNMFGYLPGDVEKGLNISQLLTADSMKKGKKKIEQILAGKITTPNEYEMIKKDGRKIYCRIHTRPMMKEGKIMGLRGTVTDITDIKLAEQKLREKNLELSVLNRIITLGNESQSLQEFLEKSYDQVLDIVDFDRGGIYLYDYNTKHNILILHKNVHPDFIVAVKDVDISKDPFNTIFDKEKPFYIDDFSEFMENSKKLGVHSAAIIPLRSKDEYVGSLNIGSPSHQVLSPNELELLLAIGKQMGIIIQKFESENLLKKSEEKYREAYNRINLYKDLFTHDINNIFQNILSSNELAMLYSNIPDKLQDYVEVANLIKEQVSRGAKLVSNIQKLSELEEFKKPIYSIEICSVLNNVIELIKKNLLHKKIKISIHALERQYLIKANELIFDVFENILINSVKHNRSPTIEIQIKISKKLIENTNYVKIEFIDNGIGIPDIMKDVIFERDVKKEKASGIGLGLLLIKRILENFSGSVRVEDKIANDYSKGSNFIVLIPEA